MDDLTAAENLPVPDSQKWFRAKWAKNTALILGTVAVLYGMVYVDVVLRAREAWLEGEKYWRWHEHPNEKKAELDKKFAQDKSELENKLQKNKISKDEYERKLEIRQYEYERNLEESSIKYAYVWYQTAYECFSPPESKYVKLSRDKAAAAKEKWKQELRAKKIPFEDYMID